jgi:hypothetical protein
MLILSQQSSPKLFVNFCKSQSRFLLLKVWAEFVQASFFKFYHKKMMALQRQMGWRDSQGQIPN